MNHSYHIFVLAAILLFLVWWMRPVGGGGGGDATVPDGYFLRGQRDDYWNTTSMLTLGGGDLPVPVTGTRRRLLRSSRGGLETTTMEKDIMDLDSGDGGWGPRGFVSYAHSGSERYDDYPHTSVAAKKRQADFSSMELFPTVVAFVLLTSILLQ